MLLYSGRNFLSFNMHCKVVIGDLMRFWVLFLLAHTCNLVKNVHIYSVSFLDTCIYIYIFIYSNYIPLISWLGPNGLIMQITIELLLSIVIFLIDRH